MTELTRGETWELIMHLKTVHGCTFTRHEQATLKLADYQRVHKNNHENGKAENDA